MHDVSEVTPGDGTWSHHFASWRDIAFNLVLQNRDKSYIFI